MTTAIPAGFHSVTPMLVLKDARKAVEFYKRAFGADELFVMPGLGLGGRCFLVDIRAKGSLV